MCFDFPPRIFRVLFFSTVCCCSFCTFLLTRNALNNVLLRCVRRLFIWLVFFSRCMHFLCYFVFFRHLLSMWMCPPILVCNRSFRARRAHNRVRNCTRTMSHGIRKMLTFKFQLKQHESHSNVTFFNCSTIVIEIWLLNGTQSNFNYMTNGMWLCG